MIRNKQIDIKGAMKYSTVNVHETEIPQFSHALDHDKLYDPVSKTCAGQGDEKKAEARHPFDRPTG
jgi:hypothetical protein